MVRADAGLNSRRHGSRLRAEWDVLKLESRHERPHETVVIVTDRLERVYIVRHGETAWNLSGRRQGQLDSPLTTTGEKQAERAAHLLTSSGIDAIFSSPLQRACRTAQLIGDVLGSPVTVLESLAEVHHGAFAGLTNREIEAAHPGELARRREALYSWRFPEGESYADAERRATTAIDEIAANGATTPLLVTHEMIFRMLLRVLLSLEADDALRRPLPHGAVVEVLPSSGRSILKQSSAEDCP